jgi:translocation and assembly module TamA
MSYDKKPCRRQLNALCRLFLLPSLWLAGLCILSGSIYRPRIGFADFGVTYKTTIKGDADRKLVAEMKAISSLVALKDQPPASLSLLDRRVDEDTGRFKKLLKSWGYYGCEVRADIDPKAHPVRIVFHVNTGPPYLLKSVKIEGVNGGRALGLKFPQAQKIGLFLDQPLKAGAVLDAQERLLGRIRKQGFPFPKISERRVVVDHAKQSGEVTFRVDPGPRARLGPTIITGLESVDEAFVRSYIPWKERDLYDPALLEKLQRRLTTLDLFATVRVIAGQTLDEKGRLPIQIALTERKHRTVQAGISYKTDEGPGANISWEHRNLFQRGERLAVSSSVSRFTQDAQGIFQKPYFLRSDQSLKLFLRLAKEEPDAYTSRSIKSSILVDRNLEDQMVIGGGLALKTSKVEQLAEVDRFSMISLPLHFEWDTSDDLFDPTQGGRLGLSLEPFYDASGTDLTFIKGYASFRRYAHVSENPFLVLAGKLTLGAIGGEERDAIPADERFYAGGGGSIRGYSYQSVGPREAGVPLGGRSLIVFSLEMRHRLTDSMGLVGFLDSGTVFTDTIPDSKETIRWGTGLGLRYFTPIGPLRLDAGVPLNRRPEVDDRFQVYLSLGEAF